MNGNYNFAERQINKEKREANAELVNERLVVFNTTFKKKVDKTFRPQGVQEVILLFRKRFHPRDHHPNLRSSKQLSGTGRSNQVYKSVD